MLKKVVILAAVFLFAVWMTVHWDRVTGDADAVIRFTLGFLFALLVILRPKDPQKVRIRIPGFVFPLFLAAGTLGAVAGIIFRVNMLEWVSVLLLLAACFLWVMPAHARGDVLLAFLVLFWVHPLPGQIFGWLQGGMQRLSVMGSESLLHILNVRVWGDGIVLRTGYQIFLVPEVCSGMRTSVTVFLCALGVGLLLRLKWFETLFFVLLGLGQVLLLNIARISFMVVWAPRMPPEWAENFLHDSLGSFLMIGVVLVQAEAGWWCWWSRKRSRINAAIDAREMEAPERASIIPHPLRQLIFGLTIASGVALIAFGVFVMLYKTRAFHRKEMIREVAEGLLETDPASAERAVRELLRLFPEERALLTLQANAHVLLGQFPEGLELLERVAASGVALELHETILKGWAMSRAGRLADARKLIDALAPGLERIPGVAMLKAEFAAMDGQPGEVARYIVFASQAQALFSRVRALFPFLAAYEQWEAIAAADRDLPYREFHEALIALHANEQVDNFGGLARVMRQTLVSWPRDRRLLRPLYGIAVRRQGSEWEQHYEETLRANLAVLTADELALAASHCWRLGRPELAWLVYRYLDRISADDPELLGGPAQYGLGWTTLRRRPLGIATEDEAATVDVRPILDAMQALAPVAAVRERIPYYEGIGSDFTVVDARGYLEKALEELDRRESRGALELRLQRFHALVLAQLGRFDEAHTKLDAILDAHPALEAEILLQHAVFYDQQQRGVQSYETLQAYRAIGGNQNLSVVLLEISAMMNLNLAVGAMQRIVEARERFPGVTRLDLAEAGIWDVFGFKAQALHVMRSTRMGARTPAAVDLLEDTGRMFEAERLRSSLGMPQRRDMPQSALWLPLAELAVTPRWPGPPDEAEIQQNLQQLQEQRILQGYSPFLRGLRGLELAWFEKLARGGYEPVTAADYAGIIQRWEQVGRTPLEGAMAVYQLAMHKARQADHGVALAALERAGALLPANAVVWRARLALAGLTDPALAETALAACPEDAEIFLAALVAGLEHRVEDAEAARNFIARMSRMAIEPDTRYPVETLVRAGTYLLARGWREEVIPLARAVERRAESLLAAHVFVMRCAMINQDSDRALVAARRARSYSVDKVPFYRTLIDLKVARREVDGDLLEALEHLQIRQPEERRWSEALGSLYFERGDLRRALAILGDVMDADMQGMRIQSLLLAAEAARLENRLDQAVRILDAAYALYPEQPEILNNLVYLLSQRRETLARAGALLPQLVEVGRRSFAILDTAAVVAMRAGDLAQAEAWMLEALDLLQAREYGAHEVRLNLAELRMRQGRADDARQALLALRQDPARPDHVDQRARQMLQELEMGGRR